MRLQHTGSDLQQGRPQDVVRVQRHQTLPIQPTSRCQRGRWSPLVLGDDHCSSSECSKRRDNARRRPQRSTKLPRQRLRKVPGLAVRKCQ